MGDVNALQDEIRALEAQLKAAQQQEEYEEEEDVEYEVIEEIIDDGQEFVEEELIEYVDETEYEEIIEEVEEEESPVPAARAMAPAPVPAPEPATTRSPGGGASGVRLSASEEQEAEPYRKMLRMGLPDQLVRIKMGAAGIDDKIVRAVVGEDEAPPPRGGGVSTKPKTPAAKPAARPAPAPAAPGRPVLDLGSVTLKKTPAPTPAEKPATGPGGRPKLDLGSVTLKKTGVQLVEEEPETSWKKSWGAPKPQPARAPPKGPAPKAQPAVEAPKPKDPPKNFFEAKQREDPAIAKAPQQPEKEVDPDAGMKVRNWVPMSERHPDKFKKTSKEVMDAGTKKTTKLAPLPFKQRVYPSNIPASPSGSETAIEKMLGTTLYKNVKFERVTVNAALEGQEILCLYFGASWRSGCKAFHQQLIDFYKLTSKDCNLELVYISADRTMFEFKDIYNRFPFLAIPTGTVELKNQMTKDFKVVDMPTLIVLNAQTGHFINVNGVEDVSALPSRDREAAQQLVNNKWKTSKSVPVKPPGQAPSKTEQQTAQAESDEAAAPPTAATTKTVPQTNAKSSGVGKKEKKGLLFWKKG